MFEVFGMIGLFDKIFYGFYNFEALIIRVVD